MSVTVVHGDLFNSSADALVNPVNCIGPMGAGLAKAFKRRFPGLQQAFRHVCRDNGIAPGGTWAWRIPETARFVICAATKDKWWAPSDVSFIRAAGENICLEARRLFPGRRALVAVPALGCGYGELDWDVVQQILTEIFTAAPDIDVELYTPHGVNLEPSAPQPMSMP